MAEVKTTEREFQSQLIGWFNAILERGNYPFERVSAESSVKVSRDKARFPDVQVWLNRKARQGFCGFELKTPETPVNDPETLEKAAEKARAMSADYFVTWNMRDSVIWRTPQPGEPVSREQRLKTYESIHQINMVEDLWESYKQELLKARAAEILHDLSTLHREGHLYLIDTDATFFVACLSSTADSLSPQIYKSLMGAIARDGRFSEELYKWAAKQGIATFGDAASFKMLSRQIVYRILGKVLFYETLRRWRGDLSRIELGEPRDASRRLREHFEAARRIDYQAVFEEDLPDRVPIPANAVEILQKLIQDLDRYNFSNMPQEVVGAVYEKLIPPEERHGLGQYFTNEELVDFINAFCIRSVGETVLDPTCGTGTFLIRAYDRFKTLGERDHKKLLSRLWGVDVAHFPAELATINLYRQNIAEYENFPRIVANDFFDVKPGDTFDFPPPKPTLDVDFMIKENLPVFDAAVGNFPYIRQELIERRVPGYKTKLQDVLTRDWKGHYRELFDGKGGIKLSGQADIYAYLFFHAAKFIREDSGRMGFLTSNSWLDVAYGYELQNFFLKNFKIIAVLESRCEPWFEDPAVNTVFTVIERCQDQEIRESHLVKFVKVKKRLKELIPWDMKLEATERFRGIDRLVRGIESAGSEHFKIRRGKTINTLKGHATYEDENFRIRVVRQGELRDEVETSGKTVKWGKYLRAPEVYFEILKKCQGKLVALRELAEIRRGYTTGINEFFYLPKEKISHWGIEEEFLAPVIKSPKESESILIGEKDLENFVFLCNISKQRLRKGSKKGALAYIEWGEKQYTKERKGKGGGVRYPDAPTVKGREFWYSLPLYDLGQIYWTKSYDDTFLQRFSKNRLFADQRVYQIVDKKGISAKLLAAVLNSTLFSLVIEITGRVNLGEGALDTAVEEAKEYIPCPDIRRFRGDLSKKLLRAFEALFARPIKSIFDEVKLKDRQELDRLVLEAMGLDPKKYLKPIYDGLCELVEERINLARMRKKLKGAKTLRDVDKLKEQVLDELLPDGPRNFPAEFIKSIFLKERIEISVPGEPLKLGNYFMGLQDVISEGGYKYEAKSIEEAKFIIYSQAPDSYVIKVPKNKAAVINAVDNYERYLKELGRKLFETFFTHSHDHKLAETLTRRVFEEVGLLEVPE